jgi:hypothetical protein
VTSIEIKEFSIQELIQLSTEINYQIPIYNPIKTYKIIYITIDNDGKEIQASGLIVVPQKQGPFSIVSAQHGTQFKKSTGAASELGGSIYESLPPAVFGYIVFMTDYLGFGTSQNLFHPYHCKKLTASACLDMLRAGFKFCQNNNINLTNKLYLMGYSEGGYATMALHKEIEENYGSEFHITASAPGAGAFNLSETAKYYINAPKISIPAYLPYVFLAYLNYFNLNVKISDIFQEPYAGQMLILFDGTKSVSEINNLLSDQPQKLLNPQFIQDFNGSGYSDLKNVLGENNVYNWKPNVPIRLFHGVKDSQVPFFNSQNAYDVMKANGVKDIELVPCTIGSQDHSESAIYWFIDCMVWFSKFQTI